MRLYVRGANYVGDFSIPGVIAYDPNWLVDYDLAITDVENHKALDILTHALISGFLTPT
jgi:hypothetical protein